MNEIKHEVSSGNLYADMGLPDADGLLARSEIGYHVFKALKSKNLKRRKASKILDIKQSAITHLMNGHFSEFSTEELLEFLRRLESIVTIVQSEPRSSKVGPKHNF